MSTEDLVRELQSRLDQAIAQKAWHLARAHDAQKLAEGLRVVIASYTEMPPAPPIALHSSTQEHAPKASPIVERIERAVDSIGRPVHYRALLPILLEQGVEIPGKDPSNNVNAHMSRRKDLFENVGKGLWALTRWTPEQKAASPLMPAMVGNETTPMFEGGFQLPEIVAAREELEVASLPDQVADDAPEIEQAFRPTERLYTSLEDFLPHTDGKPEGQHSPA